MHGVNTTLALIAGIGIIAMILITGMEVVGRYFLNRPFHWVLEINEYIMVFAAFLGMAYTMQVGGHVAVDVIYKLYSEQNKHIAELIVAVLSLIVWAILTLKGLQQSLLYLERNIKSSTLLAVPQFYPMLLVVAGSLICCFQALLMIYDGATSLAGKDSKKHSAEVTKR